MLKLIVAYPTVLRLEGGVFMIQFFICPLLVGLLVAIFEYWLNNRGKK
ncbi:type I toxin-antitoxin system Fst family toxin [Enterococcus casseliflavus]